MFDGFLHSDTGIIKKSIKDDVTTDLGMRTLVIVGWDTDLTTN